MFYAGLNEPLLVLFEKIDQYFYVKDILLIVRVHTTGELVELISALLVKQRALVAKHADLTT